ncbi:MAG: Nramp family divalent metal transporter [Melioribacteraceae bacterium]
MKETKKKILLFLASIGPGMFLVGYNIGTGSVTTMAQAGASFNMSLTWTILVACIFTYYLLIAFGRYTVVTGETALFSYKKHFGKPVALFVLFICVFTEMVSSIGVMAIVTDVVREWSRPLTPSGEGISTIILALTFGIVMVFTLFTRNYSFIEKVLTIFVALMGISFLMTMFMVIPDASIVIKGLVPSIPDEVNGALVVTGMLGTTMGGVLYVMRSVTIKQKKWTLADLKIEKRDALISASMMLILSVAVMACAAGTLFPKGLRIENAIDMIRLLEPLAGRFAISLFVVGIVCAGLSSLYPHYMLVPLLLSDYLGEELDFSKLRNKLIVVFYASLGLVVPVFGGRPVLVMIASQTFTLIVTPLVIILTLILLNKRSLMGENKAGLGMNVMLAIIAVFTIVMSFIGAEALLGVIS